MTAKHVKKAVDALYATISTGLQAQLTAVETAESLTAGSLTAPEAYLKHAAPLDNRSPLIQVYSSDWSFADGADERNDIMDVNCVVALSYSGDADLANAELFVMRYVWALIETIHADSTLGGEGVAYIENGDSQATLGDSSATRHVETISVRVHVHST